MTFSPGRRTALLTGLALIAFAANSILARAALVGDSIDPASFSTLRILSGAVALWGLAVWRRSGTGPHTSESAPGSWLSAAMLAVYAIPFSFAYVELSTGTGALILFAFVQLTMIGGGIAFGERPRRRQWIGLALASGGLVYLLLPGLTAPPAGSASSMALAGVGWGIYSLRGRGGRAPVAATRGNFTRAIPLALAVSVVAAGRIHMDPVGAYLAIASGAFASGLGYAVWYIALPGLTSTAAGIVQLSVPVIAAVGGVVFLAERVSFRLAISGITVLAGIALATLDRRARPVRTP